MFIVEESFSYFVPRYISDCVSLTVTKICLPRGKLEITADGFELGSLEIGWSGHMNTASGT
jgi:hypothetical protein